MSISAGAATTGMPLIISTGYLLPGTCTHLLLVHAMVIVPPASSVP
jgi:hypothetical protein